MRETFRWAGDLRKIEVKEGHIDKELRVEVLYTMSSRLPIPTIFPAGTYLNK